jgi:hypothetical protein
MRLASFTDLTQSRDRPRQTSNFGADRFVGHGGPPSPLARLIVFRLVDCSDRSGYAPDSVVCAMKQVRRWNTMGLKGSRLGRMGVSRGGPDGASQRRRAQPLLYAADPLALSVARNSDRGDQSDAIEQGLYIKICAELLDSGYSYR